MLSAAVDLYNPAGRTATPIVFTNITIEGNGSTLQWSGGIGRAFSVGTASININPDGNMPNVVSGTGNLTIRNIYIRGFVAKGGNGASGGGGGMGAGGAIYVMESSSLTVDGSTFEGNGATGGNGGHRTQPGDVVVGAGAAGAASVAMAASVQAWGTA